MTVPSHLDVLHARCAFAQAPECEQTCSQMIWLSDLRPKLASASLVLACNPDLPSQTPHHCLFESWDHHASARGWTIAFHVRESNESSWVCVGPKTRFAEVPKSLEAHPHAVCKIFQIAGKSKKRLTGGFHFHKHAARSAELHLRHPRSSRSQGAI